MRPADSGPLLAQLAALAVTNTAAQVVSRIKAVKTGKQHEQQVNELTRSSSTSWSTSATNGFDRPGLRAGAGCGANPRPRKTPGDHSRSSCSVQGLDREGGGEADAAEMIDPIKSVLSAEMLTVL